MVLQCGTCAHWRVFRNAREAQLGLCVLLSGPGQPESINADNCRKHPHKAQAEERFKTRPDFLCNEYQPK